MVAQPYAIMTAARDEQSYIRATLDSVVAQTRHPCLWVIVSDGSADCTEHIVTAYAERYPFIHLLRREATEERDFRSKAHALSVALAYLWPCTWTYLSNLDSDVSFGHDYFERLLERFGRERCLGIAGGIVIEDDGTRRFAQRVSTNSVAGAVQCFRRECLEEIGGYVGSQYGGEDAAVEIVARMRGWCVKTFPELPVIHHGYRKNLGGSFVRKRFRWGRMFFVLGYHPLFLLARCVMRVFERPIIVGSVAELLGFLVMYLQKTKRLLDTATVRYLRREQLERLTKPLKRGR